MIENINSQIEIKKQNKTSFIEFLKKECVLIISVLLGIGSCFISSPKLSYIDFKVLILLFNLMIVVAAFNELKVLDSIAVGLLKKCKSYKGKNKKLETACNYYNIINENAHRADSDTKATAELFLIIKDEVL